MTTADTTAEGVTSMPRIGDLAPEFTASTTRPADWRPGDRVIVPPAGSCGVAADRMAGAGDGVECEDWFFCTKDISATDVEAAIRRK